jgi:hypothetical protein
MCLRRVVPSRALPDALHLQRSLESRTVERGRDSLPTQVPCFRRAGVSSAFGAPIGGILFSVEQGSSFYSINMLGHAFLASGIAIFVSAARFTAQAARTQSCHACSAVYWQDWVVLL